jgi:hypothetical protein
MATLSVVQSVVGNTFSLSNVVGSASFNLTAGNHVFVYVWWLGASSVPNVTVSDAGGNTYTRIYLDLSSSPSGAGGAWFKCVSAAGKVSNAVTANLNGINASSGISVRVIELSGTAPVAITVQSVVGGSSVTIPDDASGLGTDWTVLIAESASNNEGTALNFTGAGLTYTRYGTLHTNCTTAYAPVVAGIGRATYTFAGTATTHVMSVVKLANSTPATPSSTVDVSKYAGYAVEGGAVNAVTATKFNAYAVRGGALNAGTISKISAYAVTGTVPITSDQVQRYNVNG